MWETISCLLTLLRNDPPWTLVPAWPVLKWSLRTALSPAIRSPWGPRLVFSALATSGVCVPTAEWVAGRSSLSRVEPVHPPAGEWGLLFQRQKMRVEM